MSARNTGIVWLVLVGVFLAGGVTGGFVALRVARSVIEEGRGAEQFAMRHLKRMTDTLALTEAQEAKIQKIIEKASDKLRVQRRASAEAMRTMEAEILPLLTTEQRVTYEKMQAEQRERWQKMMEKRGPRPPGRDDDSSGPGAGNGSDGAAPPPPPPPAGAP